MFCIILADHPNGSCKRSACKCTVFKPGLRVKKSKNAALLFWCGQWIRILCVSMTPSPQPYPSTSHLRPLNPATPHNNNKGGPHACVRAARDTEPIRITRAKYCAPLPLRWPIKDYGQLTNHFCLLVVFSVSPSTVFLYTVCKHYAHALSLLLRFGEFQAPPIGLE